jgi:DNA (cytosine-5)-methyltransferase 1
MPTEALGSPKVQAAKPASDELERPESLGCGESWAEYVGSQGRFPATSPSARLASTRSDHLGAGAYSSRPSVIPGPQDPRWPQLLATHPELRPALSEAEAQSLVRRGVDAMAYRVERLRACGNGVDPLAAATAFLSLDALLSETEESSVVLTTR